VSLSGRQLYRDESLAAAHDVVRHLNDRDDSPLSGEIKLLGVGVGRVAQAPLAQELKKLFATDAFGAGRKGELFRDEAKKFYVNYFKQISQVFGPRGTAASTASSRRPRSGPSSASRPTSSAAWTRSTSIGPTSGASAESSRRGAAASGNLRFESDGAWKGTSVDQLAKELRLALQYRRARPSS